MGITVEPRNSVIPLSSISFKMFHSLAGAQVWAPLRFINGGLFYESEQHWQTFLQNLRRRARRDARLMEINLYSFTDTQATRDPAYFSRFRVETSMHDFLQNIIALRLLRRESKNHNHKISILLLNLGPRELASLRDPMLQTLLADLLENSAPERMFIFIMAPLVEQFPARLLRTLEWVAFLGDANAAFALRTRGSRELGTYNVNRELAGWLFQNSELLTPVHDLLHRSSAYRLANELVGSEEEIAYQRLLDSLREQN